jgi:FkbM family methyltransferase
MNILIHGTLLNPGGISHHTKEFSKFLSKYHNVKIRNFNIPFSWTNYTGPDVYKNLDELDDIHHKMLYQQSLRDSNDNLIDFPLSGYDEFFKPDFHLIMAEANHYYHYQDYDKPVIVYFPWETTKLNDAFLEKLKNVDYIWVPSEWQLNVLKENGVNPEKIKVVPEGVDPIKYNPINTNNKKLRILHIGTWEYRKSSYEIINAFLNVFGDSDNVEFRIGVNNKFRKQDGPLETFRKFGLPIQKNIVFLDTLYEEDYINEIQNADVYVSCARSEGWNLPLIQSLACGVPSIYSKCGGQLEFTKENIGVGINIIGEEPAQKIIKINGNKWNWDLYTHIGGNLYLPDYQHFENELKNLYNSWLNGKYDTYKKQALLDSVFITKNFNWNKIAENATNILNKYMEEKNNKNKIYYLIHSVSFGDTLAATPTLRYLSQSHNQKINVVSHKKHIFKNNPYVNDCLSFNEFNDLDILDIIKYESFTYAGRQDNNGIEKKFSHIDTRQLHAIDLGFQLMPHQMEYDYNPDYVELEYDLPEKYVVCHITQNWANRTWDTKNWQRLINWLSENKIFTILIGQDHSEKLHDSISIDPLIKACPKLENLYGLDLTNKIELEEMYQVIKSSFVIVTMDTGPLHIAGCTDTHILQLGSATNPLLRIPYRNNTQNYKYDFVGGSCNIFCNSDLKYNVKEWGHINSIAPLTDCAENKPTFECHPHVDKVIDKLKEIIKFQEENKYLEFFELLPDNDEDRINFNFKKTTNDVVSIVVKDVTTGLLRDEYTNKCVRQEDGYFWWTPMPGKIKNLGDVDLYFYLNGIQQGKKRLYYDGGLDLNINGEKYKLDYLDGHDYPTFWEIFIHCEYDKEPLCVVEEGDVVLDIGANKGFFTLDALQKGASKVYSVEPVKHSYEQIKKLLNDFPNVEPINKAISETNGTITMFVDSDASASNCVTSHGHIFGRDSNKVEVESVNINTLIEQINEKINFMKVDCEGSELELFKTISEKNLKNIDKLVIETHGDEIDKFVYDSIISNNFRVYRHNNILFAVNEN